MAARMGKLREKIPGRSLAHRLTCLSLLIWALYMVEVESDIQTPQGKIKFCYDVDTEGHRYNSTVIGTHYVVSRHDCAVQCVHNKCCRTANYRKEAWNDGKPNCILFHLKASNRSKRLLIDDRYDHLVLLEPFRTFNCNCSSCKNNGICSTESKNCKCPAGYIGKRCQKGVPVSCKVFLQRDSSVKDGVYTIKTNTTTNYSKVYCRMTSLPGCSGGGWTLVMKIDGDKETFDYLSSYWRNKKPYNPTGGWSGLDSIETKLPTYWSTPFEQVCVGMKVGNDLKFISINYTASSLYSLIADGQYRSTNIGRQKWKSLINGSSLQKVCIREGFNLFNGSSEHEKARLGIIADEASDCSTPDSYIGFGGIGTPRHKHHSCKQLTNNTHTCGNVARCTKVDNGVKNITAIGYIFIR